MYTSRIEKCAHAPTEPGGHKECPFGTRPLEQRCSVLYLLARLTGRLRISPDGNTHFVRQESRQIFANGNEQKDRLLSEAAASIPFIPNVQECFILGLSLVQLASHYVALLPRCQ